MLMNMFADQNGGDQVDMDAMVEFIKQNIDNFVSKKLELDAIIQQVKYQTNQMV